MKFTYSLLDPTVNSSASGKVYVLVLAEDACTCAKIPFADEEDALYTIDTLCAEPLTVTDPDEGETVYPETDPTVYE